jgi:hypothetical protein
LALLKFFCTKMIKISNGAQSAIKSIFLPCQKALFNFY